MKSMRGLSMNKIVGSIKKRSGGTSDPVFVPAGPGETPETTAHKNVKAFCESAGNAKNDEVLFLPPIVEAAESSPTAAAECARLVRKYFSKEHSSRPSWQCNAIMLMRILADNPGPTFTRNMDAKFVDTVGALLKGGKDGSVRQMMMDTLDEFERTKSYDENLGLLIQMWLKEREKLRGPSHPVLPPRPLDKSPEGYSQQNYFSRHHNNMRLPPPVELSSRLEEARTSAKLLEQVVMNTAAEEMLDNELIKEFANRCLSASRSIQGYMVSTEPAADNDTMESLIDTNEQLQAALSQHQRAVLGARKQLGLNERSENASPAPQEGSTGEWQLVSAASSGSGSGRSSNGKGKDTDVYSPPPGPPHGAAEAYDPGRGRAPPPPDDPFRDQEDRDGFAARDPTMTSQTRQHEYLAVQPDEEDLYSSSPKRKEPMYRY